MYACIFRIWLRDSCQYLCRQSKSAAFLATFSVVFSSLAAFLVIFKRVLLPLATFWRAFMPCPGVQHCSGSTGLLSAQICGLGVRD